MSMTLDEFLAADPHELALRLKKKRPKPEKSKAEGRGYPVADRSVLGGGEVRMDPGRGDRSSPPGPREFLACLFEHGAARAALGVDIACRVRVLCES